MPYYEQNVIDTFHPDYCFAIATPDMLHFPEDHLVNSRHVWHGVAIGWSKELSDSVENIESTTDRIVGVRMQIARGSLLLISFYAPTAGRDEEFLEAISSLTEYLERNVSAEEQVIIGADANCSIKSSKRRQYAWKNFCDQHNLRIHSPPCPTFHHNNGLSHSSIDLFVASCTLDLGATMQYCTLDDPLNLSSHDPIESSVSIIREKPEESKFKNTYTEFKRKKVVWDASKIPEYQTLAASSLSDALSYWDNPESLPLLSCLFSNLLVRCAALVFDTHSPPSNLSRKLPPLKIRQAQNLLKKTFKLWKNDGKPTSLNEPTKHRYAEARKNLQKLTRQEKNFHHIRQHNHLMLLDRRNRSSIFSAVKKARGESSKTTTTVLHTPVGAYHGEDVLEGFAADAEHLGKCNEHVTHFDQGFYKLCKLDNLYIFDFYRENDSEIPPMTMSQLQHILSSRMKAGKACDVYQLTVEHIRNCGHDALLVILQLINKILKNIYYLSCPQMKLGLGSAVWKGKKKPLAKSTSYRRITVTPILGAIVDYYLDPQAEAVFRPAQSPDQLGFTAGISYLLAAIHRGECQRWAIDRKLTCFGVSLDGEAAFPSVEREIQVRELYAIGERGDMLQYSRNTYRNTECHLKQGNLLSRRVREDKGNRQGHVRASGHFKVYINPCLLSLRNSNLGFNLGPLCTTAVCVADDAYLFSGTPSGLQGALNIISNYAKKYQLNFNAEKTKIVVTGSKVDMNFYKDTRPWTLNGERIRVVDNNNHLGLVVSGSEEEQKNDDKNILKCRNSLFALLGPAFSYKCLLSPIVQSHLWRACSLPVLISGLPALPIRPTQLRSLEIFQQKVLRGLLKLSGSSPTSALFFLLGELPVEGVLHIRTLGLLHNIWCNQDTTVYSMVVYILKMCSSSSTTWSNHLQIICQQYGLPSPLSTLLQKQPCSKEAWNSLVKTKVTIWHERKQREAAANNSKMTYLNVQLHGLSGRPHPVLQNIYNTQDVKKLRLHLKFLTCDYLTNDRLANDQPGKDPACSLCGDLDSIEHVILSCRVTSTVRSRLLPDLLNVVARVQPTCDILRTLPSPATMTQFVLDCTSINLPDLCRIPAHNPGISDIFQISRDWCFAISSERSRLLKLLNVKTTFTTQQSTLINV